MRAWFETEKRIIFKYIIEIFEYPSGSHTSATDASGLPHPCRRRDIMGSVTEAEVVQGLSNKEFIL
jgi:hypothetical protein